jgi:aerobic-type carbon monoxide dehydrogenase small subunit (CoxS/CutS family)
MASDEKKLKGILDKNQKYLDGIHEGIVEGVDKGIKRGTSKGVKRAAWDVLEECLPQGFMDVSASDIKDISRSLKALVKNIDGDITGAANDIVERNIKQYRGRLVADIIKKFRGQKPELASVLDLVTQREKKVGELISGRLPNNPISSGIAKGVQTALRIGIDKSKEAFGNELKGKLEGVYNITGESQDTKTAQRVEKIRADSKSITHDAVAKVVEEIVYSLLKMLHKRVLAQLRKEMGEQFIHKLEEKISDITRDKLEQLFEKSTDQLVDEMGKDSINENSFVENIDKTFGNSAEQSLKSLTKWRIPGELTRREFLKDAGFIVAGGAIGAGTTYPLASGKETTVEIPGPTVTVPGPTVQVDVPTFVDPFGHEFATFDELVAHMETDHPDGLVVVDNFKCPYDDQNFATLAALEAHLDAVHGGEFLPTPEGLTTLTVNGRSTVLEIEPEWTLAFVLREKLGLSALKQGCDRGSCGTCTIIVDGKAVYACMMLAIEAEGKNIQTVEGLSDGITLDSVQQTYVDGDALQCGFCTPGFIMATKALLDSNPNPTRDEVREALSGHLCTCGTQKRIVDAVLQGGA